MVSCENTQITPAVKSKPVNPRIEHLKDLNVTIIPNCIKKKIRLQNKITLVPWQCNLHSSSDLLQQENDIAVVVNEYVPAKKMTLKLKLYEFGRSKLCS